MTTTDIIRAAIPDASEEVCDYILWNRTAFPFDVSARKIYKAASRSGRASRNGLHLCDYCDRMVNEDENVCQKCRKPLDQ